MQTTNELKNLKKEELYKLSQKLHIGGRSTMNKQELIQSISKGLKKEGGSKGYNIPSIPSIPSIKKEPFNSSKSNYSYFPEKKYKLPQYLKNIPDDEEEYHYPTKSKSYYDDDDDDEKPVKKINSPVKQNKNFTRW